MRDTSIEYHLRRLNDLFSGQTPDPPFFLRGIGHPIQNPRCIGMYDRPEDFAEDGIRYLRPLAPESLLSEDVFRPLCLTLNLYQTHFIDRVFGCEVWYQERENQWYNRYLPTPVGELEMPDLDDDPTWRQAKEITAAYLSKDLDGLYLATPTLSSPLNIAVNLYGEEILAAMHTDPEAARHDLRVINDVIVRMHRWFIDTVPREILQPVVPAGRFQPPGHGQLCGCTTQLLSPEMYAEFIAPLDAEILGLYPRGGMIHLCGAHTQHIPVWREMKILKSVQMNDRAADDFDLYYEGLREDQILYLNPTETVTAEYALRKTGGHRLVVCE